MVQHVWTLAQSSNDSAAGAIALLVQLAIIVLTFVGMWKVFVKAGHPGWAAIVPIYNLYILTQIAGRA
jgi:hypothetical protein